MGGGVAYGGARILRSAINRLLTACGFHIETRAVGKAFYFSENCLRGNYNLTADEKRKILLKMSKILDEMVEIPKPEPAKPDVPEMLTIKECVKALKGVTEHAVRRLVVSGKIPSIRIGEGKYGKILISKWDLYGYFGGEKLPKYPPT